MRGSIKPATRRTAAVAAAAVVAAGAAMASAVAASAAATTAPASQPAEARFSSQDLALCFDYPATWIPQKTATARLDVAAPPCPAHARAELCLDVPHLPPHLSWMISAKRVEDGYVKDLKQKEIPDAQVDESTPVLVNGCQQARLVKCSGHDHAGDPTCDVAVIAIRSGTVYIFSCDSNPLGDLPARAALDDAIATLRWTR